MDKNTEKRALAALEREKKRQKRQNAWNAAHYYRISLALPDDMRDGIRSAAGAGSINSYIIGLIREDLERREASSGAGPAVDPVEERPAVARPVPADPYYDDLPSVESVIMRVDDRETDKTGPETAEDEAARALAAQDAEFERIYGDLHL